MRITEAVENLVMGTLDLIMPWLMLIVVVGLVVGIPLLVLACWQDSRRETFSLKKDEWSCTRIHEYTTSHMVMVGKVMVPQTTTHNDCIQWSHK